MKQIKKILLGLFLIIAFVICFIACQDENNDVENLIGTWHLIEIKKDGQLINIQYDSSIVQQHNLTSNDFYNVTFNEDGNIQSIAFSNTIDAKYEVNGNRIRVYDVLSTQVLSSFPSDSIFLYGICTVNSYNINSSVLLLFSESLRITLKLRR
ncbi:MAG: META domain-containing protein [Bacteroidales bacterium]|nr:META domain-containing protein [Bacteroidales bacterium]